MNDRSCPTGRDLYELLNKGLFKGSLDIASSSFAYDYAVYDDDKQDFIVPVGKYSFIGKFHNGLAKVCKGLIPFDAIIELYKSSPIEYQVGMLLDSDEKENAFARHMKCVGELTAYLSISYGLINEKGVEVVRPMYSSIQVLESEGLVIATMNGQEFYFPIPELLDKEEGFDIEDLP